MQTINMSSSVGTLALPDTAEARAVFHEVVQADCYGIKQLHDSGFRPQLIWDLGASWGVASALLAHWWPEAIIWAFEPAPDRSLIAARNAAAFPNVRVFSRGLVGHLHRDESAALAGIAFDGVWRSSAREFLQWDCVRHCTSVSAFLDENPLPAESSIDLIKVDI